MGRMVDGDKIIEELEKYSRSKICDSHTGCPYIDGKDICCENCGAIGALEIVKERVSD